MAFLAPQGRDGAVAAKNAQEIFLRDCAKAATIPAFDGVVGNEIDLGCKARGACRASWCACSSLSFTPAIRMYSNRSAAFSARRSNRRPRARVVERIFAIHRHDLAAHFVGRAVQRNGEAKLRRLVGELANLRREPAGRDR